MLPALSRRRLLALAIAFTGVALLAAGLVPDVTTVLLIVALAGIGAGVAANTGHTLLDQEAEDYRRARTTEHLHAVVRVCVALGAVVAPVVAAAIGPHRLENGKFVFAHGGAAFTLMLVGALLLPVAALVLGQGRRPAGRAAAARPAGRAARRRRPGAGARGHRLLHRPGGRRRRRQVHPGRGARRVDPGQGPRGRA